MYMYMNTHVFARLGDACYGVTCQNGGTCRDNQHVVGGDYLCDCDYGFHGRHCELQRCTESFTCYNEGLCTYVVCFLSNTTYIYACQVHPVLSCTWAYSVCV